MLGVVIAPRGTVCPVDRPKIGVAKNSCGKRQQSMPYSDQLLFFGNLKRRVDSRTVAASVRDCDRAARMAQVFDWLQPGYVCGRQNRGKVALIRRLLEHGTAPQVLFDRPALARGVPQVANIGTKNRVARKSARAECKRLAAQRLASCALESSEVQNAEIAPAKVGAASRAAHPECRDWSPLSLAAKRPPRLGGPTPESRGRLCPPRR